MPLSAAGRLAPSALLRPPPELSALSQIIIKAVLGVVSPNSSGENGR